MAWKKLGSPTPKQSPENYKPYEWQAQHVQALPIPIQDMLVTLGDALKSRITRRVFDQITLKQLAHFLWFSCRVQDAGNDDLGFRITKRPSPSAGAIHPIHVLVHLEDGHWWRYDAFEHSLIRVDEHWQDQRKAYLAATEVLDPGQGLIMFFLAEAGKTSAKYDEPESLIWRDAGAMLGVMSLVAEGAGLAFCPLGITGEPCTESLDQQHRLVGVGMAVIGGAAFDSF